MASWYKNLLSLSSSLYRAIRGRGGGGTFGKCVLLAQDRSKEVSDFVRSFHDLLSRFSGKATTVVPGGHYLSRGRCLPRCCCALAIKPTTKDSVSAAIVTSFAKHHTVVCAIKWLINKKWKQNKNTHCFFLYYTANRQRWATRDERISNTKPIKHWFYTTAANPCSDRTGKPGWYLDSICFVSDVWNTQSVEVWPLLCPFSHAGHALAGFGSSCVSGSANIYLKEQSMECGGWEGLISIEKLNKQDKPAPVNDPLKGIFLQALD